MNTKNDRVIFSLDGFEMNEVISTSVFKRITR